jgi:hypothetical protein
VSPVRYKLGFYIQEDDILHSYRRETLKSYILISIVLRSEQRKFSCLLYITAHIHGSWVMHLATKRLTRILTTLVMSLHLLYYGDQSTDNDTLHNGTDS